MTVKAEHAPYLVQIGQAVTFTMGQNVKELAGKPGLVINKTLKQKKIGESTDIFLAYAISVQPPILGLPEVVWCWRCGFEVVR